MVRQAVERERGCHGARDGTCMKGRDGGRDGDVLGT